MGQIVGNADFGLEPDETLNLIAASAEKGDGVLAIFWLWFLENGVGTLFSEGTFKDSSKHLQVIDYDLFLRNAPVTESDFSGPFLVEERAAKLRADAAHGHHTRLSKRHRTPN
jgi:hypothetical protein